MKLKIRRKKRITFLRLFVSSVLLAFMASFAFAFGLREYFRIYIRNEAQAEAQRIVSDTMSKINKLNAVMKFDDNTQSSWYVCEREHFNLPQLDELFEYCKSDYSDTYCYHYIVLDSAYVNKSDYSFIPHTGMIEISKKIDNDGGLLSEYETLETKEINIEFDDENYELITLNHPPSKETPRAYLCGFYGVEKNILDNVTANVNTDNESWSFSTCWKNFNGKDLLFLESLNSVYIDGKSYKLYTSLIVDDNSDIVMKLYWKYVIIVSAVLFIAAFLLSWSKNVINKSRYAFEDYQKALINNLAHDLKTPMTAIGGYAENARQYLEKGNSEHIASFLDAISENVFYIDTIVNRTLELNHLNKIQKAKKESVQIHKIAETSIEKYNLILSEKNITVELNGECELMADKASIESAIENLISNAVKYTVENGRIMIKANKNSLTITNDTADNVDTKNLVMPFVKGDKSRNDKSSGIGLAIVKSAADLNHLKLTISSSENQFKAVLSK